MSLALAVLFVAPANAADPTLTATFSPGSANTGADTLFTLNVSSNQGQLQTLMFTAPSGFSIGDVKASSGNTPNVTGQTITVSGLKISGSEVLNVQIHAFPQCTPDPTPAPANTWTLDGIQKGGAHYATQPFSTHVNEVTADTPSSCKLVFRTVADQRSSTALVPFPFQVKVDIKRADDTIDAAYGNQVSLSLEADPGENENPNLTSDSPVTPDGGTATFTARIAVAGYGYVLEACSSPITGALCGVLENNAGFRSNAFAVYDDVVLCENGKSCLANGNGDQVTTQVSATGQNGKTIKAGVYSVTGGTGDLADLDCAGYNEITEEVTTFGWDGDGLKFVTNVISAEQMKEIANQGVSFLQTCFASSIKFTDRFGADAVQVPSLGVIPGGLWVGLLKDCPSNKKSLTTSAPCVVSRQGGGNGTGTITYVAKVNDPGGSRH